MPLVSIIVTTYNRKDKLTETIQSILNQTFQNFELIVVDNCSDYDFLEFISSFSNHKIIPLQNNNNGIIAVNRNVGIKIAKGEFIAFCDDDDIWVPNKLTVQIDALILSKADFVSSNAFIFETDIHKVNSHSNNRAIKNIKDFLKSNQVSTSTVVLRNSEMVQFNENPYLLSIEDYALWLDLYLAGYKFIFIEESLIYYRYCNTNISTENWIKGHYRKLVLYSQIAVSHNKIALQSTIIVVILKNIFMIVIKNIIHFFKRKVFK